MAVCSLHFARYFFNHFSSLGEKYFKRICSKFLWIMSTELSENLGWIFMGDFYHQDYIIFLFVNFELWWSFHFLCGVWFYVIFMFSQSHLSIPYKDKIDFSWIVLFLQNLLVHIKKIDVITNFIKICSFSDIYKSRTTYTKNTVKSGRSFYSPIK